MAAGMPFQKIISEAKSIFRKRPKNGHEAKFIYKPIQNEAYINPLENHIRASNVSTWKRISYLKLLQMLSLVTKWQSGTTNRSQSISAMSYTAAMSYSTKPSGPKVP